MSRVTTFFVDEKTERPKSLRNNVFALYSPERITLKPGDLRKIDMKVGVKLPSNIIGTCTLITFLERESPNIQNSSYISTENNIANINQPTDLPWWINLELLNRSTNNTTFRFIKRQDIGYFMTINEWIENFQPKHKEEIKSTNVL